MNARWSATEFRAMGTDCRIVAPDADAAAHGVELVRQLERSWSRFLPDSEVSELNRSAGSVCLVSEVTYELLARAEQARVRTGHAFNPLMLDQLETLGYDRTWEHVERNGTPVVDGRPGCTERIELYAEVRGVRLPDGTRFDPGGIGKGLAGDLVAAALRAAGAESVQVELGGDVRVDGPAWDGGEWRVVVADDDHDTASAATITLAAGGVATSSVVRRRWRRGSVEVHHLLDSATGASADTDLDAVTAVASELWWAEVAAKVALVAGSPGARAVLARHGASGVLVAPGAPARYDVVELAEAAA